MYCNRHQENIKLGVENHFYLVEALFILGFFYNKLYLTDKM